MMSFLGTRYDLRSKEVEKIYALTKLFQDNFSVLMFLPMFIPALNKLPKPIRNTVFMEDTMEGVLGEMKRMVDVSLNHYKYS